MGRERHLAGWVGAKTARVLAYGEIWKMNYECTSLDLIKGR